MVNRAIAQIKMHTVITIGINQGALKLENMKHTRPVKNAIADMMKKLIDV